MIIYLFLLIEILLFNYFLRIGIINKKKLCVLLGISFILITGLRSNNVGSDTTVYYLDFMDMKKMSFKELLSLQKRDELFYITSWIISKKTGSFVLLTLFTAFMFYYPIMKVIYKYSDDCGLSCIILMAFNFFQFSMTGMRQTIAIGFAVLFFLELHKKKFNLFKATTYIVAGIFYHRSCLIALLFLLFKWLAKKKKLVTYSAILVPIFFVFKGNIISSMFGVFEYLGFGEYTAESYGAGLTTFFLYALLIGFGLLFFKADEDKEFPLHELLLIIIVGTALQAFVLVNSVFFRVAWYFAIYFVVYIPKVTTKTILMQKDSKLIELGAYCALLFMYLFITKGSATVLPYQFFFQG